MSSNAEHCLSANEIQSCNRCRRYIWIHSQIFTPEIFNNRFTFIPQLVCDAKKTFFYIIPAKKTWRRRILCNFCVTTGVAIRSACVVARCHRLKATSDVYNLEAWWYFCHLWVNSDIIFTYLVSVRVSTVLTIAYVCVNTAIVRKKQGVRRNRG